MALLIVLWVVALLAVLASSVLATTTVSLRGARKQAELAGAGACADAGIARALMGLLEPVPAKRWRADWRVHQLGFEEHQLAIRIQDETGKVDLNAAPDELLLGVFAGAGLAPEAARALVDKIGDWRDPDDLKRMNGAEAADYAAAGFDYAPRNRPFEAVDELAMVLGMSPQLLRKVSSALTVYSQQTTIDTTTAPLQALLALPGMTPERAAALLAERNAPARANTLQGFAAPSPSGRAFTVRATCRTANGVTAERETIVRLTGNPRHPFAVYAKR
jgi:general secretion pathway protein K